MTILQCCLLSIFHLIYMLQIMSHLCSQDILKLFSNLKEECFWSCILNEAHRPTSFSFSFLSISFSFSLFLSCLFMFFSIVSLTPHALLQWLFWFLFLFSVCLLFLAFYPLSLSLTHFLFIFLFYLSVFLFIRKDCFQVKSNLFTVDNLVFHF
jgi:hypothetical protein